MLSFLGNVVCNLIDACANMRLVMSNALLCCSQRPRHFNSMVSCASENHNDTQAIHCGVLVLIIKEKWP